MLRRAVIGSVFILCASCCLAFFLLFHFDEGAKTTYIELERASHPIQAHNEMNYTEHMRKHVVKELFSEHAIPENVRVLSEYSELFFMGEEKNIEVIEEMQNVHCYVQEELFYLLPNGKKMGTEGFSSPPKDAKPMQRLCMMEAENATFYYSSNTLLAEKVKMWKYEAQGHSLPSNFETLSALMEGEAKSVELTFHKGEVKMAASPFRAIFETPDRAR